MTEEAFKRKLSAILSADVKGYSRLMDDDSKKCAFVVCIINGNTFVKLKQRNRKIGLV